MARPIRGDGARSSSGTLRHRYSRAACFTGRVFR
jgi:hypothetical protein